LADAPLTVGLPPRRLCFRLESTHTRALKHLKFSSSGLKLLKTKAAKIFLPVPKIFLGAQVSLNRS
jgi:hypothetical protein